MRILVTGGLGYIGSNIVKYLSELGHSVFVGSSRLDATKSPGLNLKYRVKLEWDNEFSLQTACCNTDVVIHAAGINAMGCEEDPVSALNFNGVATARLIRAASSSGVRRFVYLSTAHVYRSPLVGDISEKVCLENLHPYATSHVAGENALLYACNKKWLEGVVLRLSNIFGAPADASANCWTLFVNDLCCQAVKTGFLHIKSPWAQERDFIPMQEACRMIGYFANPLVKVDQKCILNIGSGSSMSLLEMAYLIQERCRILFGYKPAIIKANYVGERVPLNYSVDLMKSFGASLGSNLNDEIDSLLLFCQKEFKL